MHDHLWDYGQPAESERRFRAALETETDAGQRVELLSQIARAQGLQREFDAGHATLDEAEAALAPAQGRAAARCLLERGRLHNSAGDQATACGWFDRALARAEAAGEEALAIDALHMLGIAAPPEERTDWNLKALARAEAAADPAASRWRGSLYNNLGWTYHDQGRFAEALELFERGAAWRREAGQQHEERIARWSVARALRSLGRVGEAQAIQHALLAEHRALGSEDGYVYEELAECALLQGERAAAAPWAAAAHRLLGQDAWLAANEPARLERLRELAAE
ncbi:MAG TPA: tetratricopeptide repeat protein [Herpetosiphonaceae bacterium]